MRGPNTIADAVEETGYLRLERRTQVLRVLFESSCDAVPKVVACHDIMEQAIECAAPQTNELGLHYTISY